MTVTILRREKGCVTLSDGRVIQRRQKMDCRGPILWWLPLKSVPTGIGYPTLGEALRAAGVQS